MAEERRSEIKKTARTISESGKMRAVSLRPQSSFFDGGRGASRNSAEFPGSGERKHFPSLILWEMSVFTVRVVDSESGKVRAVLVFSKHGSFGSGNYFRRTGAEMVSEMTRRCPLVISMAFSMVMPSQGLR